MLPGMNYKSFTIIIYDRNDSTIIELILQNYDYDHNLWYKPKLALARIIS